MLVLSLGGPAKVALYGHLPLLQYIRTNGDTGSAILFLCLSCLPLNSLLQKNQGGAAVALKNLFSKALLSMGGITVLTIAACLLLFKAGIIPDGLIDRSTGFTGSIKQILRRLPFFDRLLINAILLFLLLSCFFLFRKRLPLNRPTAGPVNGGPADFLLAAATRDRCTKNEPRKNRSLFFIGQPRHTYPFPVANP